jgi:chaperonin cofactor prefoldin
MELSKEKLERILGLEEMKGTLQSLEKQLKELKEDLKKLENRVKALESKPSPSKPEEEVKELREALTPKPPSKPIEELIKERDALLEAVRPKPKFATVQEVIDALRRAREDAEKAKIRLEIAQLTKQAVDEIKKAKKDTHNYIQQAQQIEAQLASEEPSKESH